MRRLTSSGIGHCWFMAVELIAVKMSMRARAAAIVFAALACGKSTEPVRVPALPESLLFVSGAAGDAQILRWYRDSVVPVTTGPGENVEPSSAAGRIAFTSYRDGNSEIYLARLDGSGQHRIVTSPSFDNQPDLSRNAERVAFVSTRSGTQRIYIADSSGANVAALATGSSLNIPETAPSFSPDGSQIAFASSRTGTSQIFVVSSTGGGGTQISHETIGAFEPAWSANGDTIFFVAAAANTVIRAVHVASGRTVTFPSSPTGYLQPACAGFGCVVIEGGASASGEVVSLQLEGRRRSTLLTGLNRDPALIRE